MSSDLNKNDLVDADLSPAIVKFLRLCELRDLRLDSFVIWHDNSVIAESYVWPHSQGRLHTTHSATKSFTSLGVGLCISEGLLSLDDLLVSFFPNRVPEDASENLRRITIRDLLTMRTGHEFGLSGGLWRNLETSWIDEFFKSEVANEPGAKFVYSSASSHMLSAVVQVVSGVCLEEYLKSRIFEPLNIVDYEWDKDPEGISSGGNGLKITTRDFLKWGVLHLQGGVWEGAQIVPREWVEAATALHIEDITASDFDGRRYAPSSRESPGREGYGYQIWCGDGETFFASGMFGQVCMVVPSTNTVVAVNAAVQSGRDKMVAVTISEAFSGAACAASTASKASQDVRVPALTPPQISEVDSFVGKWLIEENEYGLSELTFAWSGSDDLASFGFVDNRGRAALNVGVGRWHESLSGVSTGVLHHSYQEELARVVAGLDAPEPRHVRVRCFFAESPFVDTIELRLDANDVLSVDWSVNVNSSVTALPTLRGTRA